VTGPRSANGAFAGCTLSILGENTFTAYPDQLVGQSNDDQMERGAVLATKSGWNPLVGLSVQTSRIPQPIRFGWMIDP
jgi:hypothetical protein